jgi:integrase
LDYQLQRRRRLENLIAGFQLEGGRPGWFDSWLLKKQAKQLRDGSILRYMDDMRVFGFDPATMSLGEIQARLAMLSRSNAEASYRRILITVKQVLKHLKRKEEAEEIPLPRKPEGRIVLLTKKEITKLLQSCVNIRDRLIIQFLTELGGRRGELVASRIKDIQFDQYSPIVWLRGKTGERRRRVYVSKVDLMQYLNNHPDHDNPNAPFWITAQGKPLMYAGFYKIVSKLGWKALGRQIYPHMFRHTRATEDSKRYTDTEMMKLFGWKTSDQVRVYSHLSMRDIDEKDLMLHGLKPASDAAEPLIETRRCPSCHAENGPVAIYCQECAAPLNSNQEAANLQKTVEELKLAVRILQDASGLKTNTPA